MVNRNAIIIYNLPERIRETRRNKGLTQTELGLAMGSNKAAVSKLENGVRIPDLMTVKKAADVMGVSLSDWFADEDSKQDPFFHQVQERVKGLMPEQREQFELMIIASLKMMGV